MKSAAKLRSVYTAIRQEDVVILLDHIGNSRFIPANANTDFSIFVSKFVADNSYDMQQDLKKMDAIFFNNKRYPRSLRE